MAMTEAKHERTHVLIYNCGFVPPDALKAHLTATPSVTDWVDIGVVNVLFVQTYLTTDELVSVVREQYRHPQSHIVAVEVAASYWGQAPKALWDMLGKSAASDRQLAARRLLERGPQTEVQVQH